MLIVRYIRSFAIDIENMGTHVSTPGMVTGMPNSVPCPPVLCSLRYSLPILSYLQGVIVTSPELSGLVSSWAVLCHWI